MTLDRYSVAAYRRLEACRTRYDTRVGTCGRKCEGRRICDSDDRRMAIARFSSLALPWSSAGSPVGLVMRIPVTSLYPQDQRSKVYVCLRGVAEHARQCCSRGHPIAWRESSTGRAGSRWLGRAPHGAWTVTSGSGIRSKGGFWRLWVIPVSECFTLRVGRRRRIHFKRLK